MNLLYAMLSSKCFFCVKQSIGGGGVFFVKKKHPSCLSINKFFHCMIFDSFYKIRHDRWFFISHPISPRWKKYLRSTLCRLTELFVINFFYSNHEQSTHLKYCSTKFQGTKHSCLMKLQSTHLNIFINSVKYFDNLVTLNINIISIRTALARLFFTLMLHH